ncbi:MAG: hypothetical protein ACRDUA_00050 [Micromonosporaceae bacterium]
MAAQGARPDPHTAVKQELLVRYLDTWTPTVLRSHRRATYLELSRDGSVAAALRVFGEFADRIAGHQLDVVVLGGPTESLAMVWNELGEPAGLTLRTVADPGGLEVSGPLLVHLDLVGESPLDEVTAWQLVVRIAAGAPNEVLATVPSVDLTGVEQHRARFADAGLRHVAHVELTDDDGRTQLLLFATGTERHLVAFKEALWAADEYAGIRYRDPRDSEHALIDISLTPQLVPLRRCLLAELGRAGETSVATLQRFTLTDTIYRPADAVRVLTSMASAGAITRDPEKGRLTPRTVVRPVG